MNKTFILFCHHNRLLLEFYAISNYFSAPLAVSPYRYYREYKEISITSHLLSIVQEINNFHSIHFTHEPFKTNKLTDPRRYRILMIVNL